MNDPQLPRVTDAVTTVFYSGPPPKAGAQVYVHNADTACVRCGGFCIDKSTVDYRDGSEKRMRGKIWLSVLGSLGFGWLTAAVTPASLWPWLIPLTAAGWTMTVFSVLNAARATLGGRNPRTWLEARTVAKAIVAQLSTIVLFAAPAYVTAWHYISGA